MRPCWPLNNVLTLFSLNKEKGVKGLYISLEQSRQSLLDHMKALGLYHAAV